MPSPEPSSVPGRASCALSPKIEQGKDEHPHQIDEVPVEAHDLDVLVAALPAGEKASRFAVKVATQHFSRNDDQEDYPDRHMGAVEARDHEEAGAELLRAPRIAPRPHALHDQLGPLETLHSDECRTECRGYQHQQRAFDAIVPVAEIDRHRHRPATTDQDEGHDGDQDEGDGRAADRQSEDFTGIGPGNGRRDPHGHVGQQEAAENEGIAEEEDPHHGLPPGDILERTLVRGPVGGDASPA